MHRLTSEDKKIIIEPYKSGNSLAKISKLIGRRKTVIYYHTRKQFGRKYKLIKFRISSFEDLGEFLGAFIGDGNFYQEKDFKYNINFYLSIHETKHAKHLSKVIKRLFSKEPNLWVYTKGNIIRLKIMGKQVYIKLKEYLDWSNEKYYTIHLKSNLLKHPNYDLLKGIIKGELATDGSVYVPKNRIVLGTCSKLLSEQNRRILEMFEINPYTYPVFSSKNKPFYHMHITGIDNVSNFYERIGVTEPLRKSKIKLILKKRQ
ncbi:MAG: LAGLIDADG family homing endonuclease [Candidatus Micrarchaeaceae archaeon]|jgi:hypothetical protein